MARLPKSHNRKPRRNLPRLGALDHAVPFEHHEEAMRRAFVQAEGAGYFRQAQRRGAGGEQVEYGKGAIERLQFINSARFAYHIVRWHAVC